MEIRGLVPSLGGFDTFTIQDSKLEQDNKELEQILTCSCLENGIFENKPSNYIKTKEVTFGFECFKTRLPNMEEIKTRRKYYERMFAELIKEFLDSYKNQKMVINEIKIIGFENNASDLFNMLLNEGIVILKPRYREKNTEEMKEYIINRRNCLVIKFNILEAKEETKWKKIKWLV